MRFFAYRYKETHKTEALLKPLLEACDGLRKAHPIIIDNGTGHRYSCFFIRSKPDLIESFCKKGFIPVRDTGHDVAHKINLASLPANT